MKLKNFWLKEIEKDEKKKKELEERWKAPSQEDAAWVPTRPKNKAKTKLKYNKYGMFVPYGASVNGKPKQKSGYPIPKNPDGSQAPNKGTIVSKGKKAIYKGKKINKKSHHTIDMKMAEKDRLKRLAEVKKKLKKAIDDLEK
jgi:hypothetical protein